MLAIGHQVQALYAGQVDRRKAAASLQLRQINPHVMFSRRVAPPEIETRQLGRQLLAVAD
jgi:hypothetical protein